MKAFQLEKTYTDNNKLDVMIVVFLKKKKFVFREETDIKEALI
jgi:hypothetical protein